MAESKKLHIVMFPWLAFGHIIPFLELSKNIAQKGHHISFLSTPKNIQRLPKIPSNLAPLINLVELPLPRVDNLPENGEATIDVPYYKIPYLKIAFDGLQESITSFLQTSTPDWIIYDFAPHWLPPIAAKLGISRAFFSIYNASSLSFFGRILSGGVDPRTEPEDFTVPPKWIPFPTNVVFRLYEAKKILELLEENLSGVADTFRFSSAVLGCEVFLIRSCTELESNWLNLLGELHGRPVVPVGLLLPKVQDSRDDKDDAWQQISELLDKHDERSIVYVALGSEVIPSEDELTELALGLELSGLPFFWALRKRPESDSDGLPSGFKERTKGRGVVWTSWAPQLRILAHESVGGFLTHSGWSSVIEALQLGRALIMLPLWGDQGLIARFLGEKEVGIEIARDEEDGSFTRNSVAESIRLVMVEEEGKTYREKAEEMRKMFEDKERHDQYVGDFVEYLQEHRPIRKD